MAWFLGDDTEVDEFYWLEVEELEEFDEEEEPKLVLVFDDVWFMLPNW